MAPKTKMITGTNRIVGEMEIESLNPRGPDYFIGVNTRKGYKIVIPSAVISESFAKKLIGFYGSHHIEVELTEAPLTRDQLEKLRQDQDPVLAALVYLNDVTKDYNRGRIPTADGKDTVCPEITASFNGYINRVISASISFTLRLSDGDEDKGNIEQLEKIIKNTEFYTPFLWITKVSEYKT